MVGEISDDGEWVWDGAEWIPNTDGNQTEELENRIKELETSAVEITKILRFVLLATSLIFGIIVVTGDAWLTNYADQNGDFGLREGATHGPEFTYEESCADLTKNMDGTTTDTHQICSLASVGFYTAIVLWFAIGSGMIRLISPLFKIANNLPRAVNIAISWSTGALMLIGTLGWMVAKPDTAMEIGMSFWLGLLAGFLALIAEIVVLVKK